MSQPDRRGMIYVQHNIEVAHRLLTLPGKCQQIHGHSMLVKLEVMADIDLNGYALAGDGVVLEFGELKRQFRGYLDSIWDHQLHLNGSDPFAGEMLLLERDDRGRFVNPPGPEGNAAMLPGLRVWPADPSTENIALWIRNHMQGLDILAGLSIYVTISETGTNGAGA